MTTKPVLTPGAFAEMLKTQYPPSAESERQARTALAIKDFCEAPDPMMTEREASGVGAQPMLTPAEFADAMRAIEEIAKKDMDYEMAHEMADILLAQLLQSLGYGDGVAVFNRMTKWYA